MKKTKFDPKKCEHTDFCSGYGHMGEDDEGNVAPLCADCKGEPYGRLMRNEKKEKK